MKKRTARILTGIAVLIVALAVLYAIAVAVSAARLRRAYAALQADGRPMHPDQVIPAAVPDTENAALLYQSAISLLKAEPNGHSLESPPGESVQEMIVRDKYKNLLGYLAHRSAEFIDGEATPEQRRELEELMGRKTIDYALFAIEQGIQRPACRFQLDYEAGANLLMPPLSDMKSLAHILAARARLEAEAGEMDRGWRLAAAGAKLADALRNEPILVSQLVRMACIRLSCRTIQRLCEMAPPGVEQQEQLETVLRTFDDVAPLVLATDGERLLFGEWLFTRPRRELPRTLQDCGLQVQDEQMPGFIRWLVVRRLAFRPTFIADHANYIRIMHANAENLKRPYSPQTTEERYGRFSLAGMLTPAADRIRSLHGQMVAEVRLTRAGLALLRYRATHGTFPAALEALNMGGLADPFTQQPLRYRAEGDGFMLYSVGEDQKDNGGAPRQERRGSDPREPRHAEYDIAWQFPARMPQAAQ